MVDSTKEEWGKLHARRLSEVQIDPWKKEILAELNLIINLSQTGVEKLELAHFGCPEPTTSPAGRS
jgi:hypothetical protein